MERSWKALVETHRMTELNFADGVQLLLQSELDSREEKRFERLKKNAAFRYQASIEELNMDPKRGMDKAQIADLITGGYIGRGEQLLMSGATGCGKSSLASALGLNACSQGKKVLYSRSCSSKPRLPDWKDQRTNFWTGLQNLTC